jgi:hypothetical protein
MTANCQGRLEMRGCSNMTSDVMMFSALHDGMGK